MGGESGVVRILNRLRSSKGAVALTRIAADWGRDLVDAATDRRCPGCHGPIERDELVCVACDGAVARLGTIHCLACLHEGTHDAAAGSPGGCERHGSERLLFAGPAYEAPLDAIIRAFKYEGRSHLAPWVASLIPSVASFGDVFAREGILVPASLHPARRGSRGYDQAQLLADEIGRWQGIPVMALLRRVRETPAQARLDPERRRVNLAGAFRLRDGAETLLRGRPALLVDDVATTGATLLAAAEALTAARPGLILALTAAHGGASSGGPEAPQS